MAKKTEWKQIFYDPDHIKYEGFATGGKPFGAGRTYYMDGTIYQEGVFDVKGLVYGREYYPSGKLRFEGAYCINSGYGPNYPVYGKCYDESGKMIHEGVLKVSRSGLGWPFVVVPKEYGSVVINGAPEIHYINW